MDFEKKYSQYKSSFKNFLEKKTKEKELFGKSHYTRQAEVLAKLHPAFESNDSSQGYGEQILNFYKSVNYSLHGDGKRFRPVLVLATAELLKGEVKDVLPLALAVEMIHTYSLIHDDLPCMDNDDLRRGKPTNHKVFGEATALLAGDALLTEAFAVIAESPSRVPELVKMLSEHAGVSGMIGGQVIDLTTQKNKVTAAELSQMQLNKTGALMKASVVGAAVVCGASEKQIEDLTKFAILVGLSFQVADDILDKDKNEIGSFVSVLGLDKTKDLLNSLTQQSQDCLKQFGEKSAFLNELARYNSHRMK